MKNEFAKFDAVMKKILSVSHAELEKLEKKYKKRRKRARKTKS